MQAIFADNLRHPHRLFRLAQMAVVLAIFLVIAAPYLRPARMQPESTNIIGYFDFKFKAKHLKNASQPWRYTWYNSGTVASVEQISNWVAGKGKLVVHDGAGKEVYSCNLGEDGAFLTNPGVAGKWTIEVVFDARGNGKF